MTNENDPDHPAHEHAPSEAETWSDNQPPVDDFADSETSEDEATLVSQEAETEEMLTQGGRSRSMFLPLAAGVGGLLVLGAVVYWQFGRSPPPPIPPMVMMAQMPAQKGSVSPSPVRPAVSTAASANAGDNELNGLYKGDSDSSYPGGAPIAPKTSMAAIPENAPSNVTGSPAGVATPAAMPNPPPAPIPTPLSSMIATSPTASASVGAGTMDARFDALQAHIDEIQKQLNQVTNMIAANQAAPVGQQTTASVDDRLNKIEQDLLQLKHNQTTAAPVPTPAPTLSAAIAVPSAVSPAPAKTKTVKPVAKPKNTNKKSAPANHKELPPPPVKTETATPTATAPHWILRAATPSEAWVSADANSPDLRHLQVGDVLPGIGRVRAIRQVGEGWVVEGTNGSVH
jgi:hypothetical protein